MDAVFQALDWKTPDGCHVCRPALNYYRLAAWPDEYVDDAQSRYINERAHGNIQKDGTYSVVPRIWGGVTTPSELRAIAAVAEKYRVPTVKFTGGQRIDLLGVKKEDLPAMWRDLGAAGFVSGHAYGKALRTVKTCVGSEWCRFGTQDSTGLGIQLEKMTWGSVPRTAAACGLPEQDVATFFQWFARTERTVTLFSQGINQSDSGVDKANAILNLHLATGRIGGPGQGPFSLTGQPNAMGGARSTDSRTSWPRTWASMIRNISTDCAASGRRRASRRGLA